MFLVYWCPEAVEKKVKMYEEEKNRVMSNHTAINQEWNKVTNDYSKSWDDGDGKEIYVESQGLDKYGRVLAKIYTLDGVCCNEELIKMGLALHYDGRKKRQELLKD